MADVQIVLLNSDCLLLLEYICCPWQLSSFGCNVHRHSEYRDFEGFLSSDLFSRIHANHIQHRYLKQLNQFTILSCFNSDTILLITNCFACRNCARCCFAGKLQSILWSKLRGMYCGMWLSNRNASLGVSHDLCTRQTTVCGRELFRSPFTWTKISQSDLIDMTVIICFCLILITNSLSFSSRVSFTLHILFSTCPIFSFKNRHISLEKTLFHELNWEILIVWMKRRSTEKWKENSVFCTNFFWLMRFDSHLDALDQWDTACDHHSNQLYKYS